MMYSEYLKESIGRCEKDIEWAITFMAYARKDINREKQTLKRLKEHGYEFDSTTTLRKANNEYQYWYRAKKYNEKKLKEYTRKLENLRYDFVIFEEENTVEETTVETVEAVETVEENNVEVVEEENTVEENKGEENHVKRNHEENESRLQTNYNRLVTDCSDGGMCSNCMYH